MDYSYDTLTVMVIDDSKTHRLSASRLLQEAGCVVVTATDGFDALSKIADAKPDIIFIDALMPRLDGYQTCALIKNNSRFRETPVIMLMGKDGDFDTAQARIVGCNHALTKPVAAEAWLQTIRDYVQ
ncbi:response regulator [bacterium]|nr:response regulator [bacterium]